MPLPAPVLASMTEETWSRQVVEWARRSGWCGIHLRQSHVLGRGFAVLAGVHAPRRGDDHDDVFGFPDWLFVRPGSPPILAELKAEKGAVSKHQRHWHDVLGQVPGLVCAVWRPSDADGVRELLIGGAR